MIFSLGIILGVVAGFIAGCRITNRQYAEILKTAKEAEVAQGKITRESISSSKTLKMKGEKMAVKKVTVKRRQRTCNASAMIVGPGGAVKIVEFRLRESTPATVTIIKTPSVGKSESPFPVTTFLVEHEMDAESLAARHRPAKFTWHDEADRFPKTATKD
jgi:hypothetical protein